MTPDCRLLAASGEQGPSRGSCLSPLPGPFPRGGLTGAPAGGAPGCPQTRASSATWDVTRRHRHCAFQQTRAHACRYLRACCAFCVTQHLRAGTGLSLQTLRCPLCGVLNPGCLVPGLSQAATSRAEAPSFPDPHLFLAPLAPWAPRGGGPSPRGEDPRALSCLFPNTVISGWGWATALAQLSESFLKEDTVRALKTDVTTVLRPATFRNFSRDQCSPHLFLSGAPAGLPPGEGLRRTRAHAGTSGLGAPGHVLAADCPFPAATPSWKATCSSSCTPSGTSAAPTTSCTSCWTVSAAPCPGTRRP